MGQKWTLETAAKEKPPGLHPFAGARLGVFLRWALGTRKLDSRTRYQRFIAWVAQILRFPGTAIEAMQYNGTIRSHTLEQPPVFLVGHWRSGTTHLHNLMSRDPRFGYMNFVETAMPLDILGFNMRMGRRAIDRALPEDRGFDKVRLTLEEPQEEEMALGNLNPIGYYNIYCFPQQMEEHRDRALFFEGVTETELEAFRNSYEYIVKKVDIAKKGRQLLFKNPASTTRLPLLLELFPDAKFIHIVRNPWEVYSSTCSHFPRIFNAFAWQSFADVDVPGFTLENYEKVMRRFLEDRDRLGLPENQLIETTYEAITGDPLGEIGRLYDTLGLGGKESGLEKIDDYLRSLEGYERNAHSITAAEADEVRKRWDFAFEAWGYDREPPASIRIL